MASRRSLTVWAVLLFATLAIPAGAAGPRKTARQRDGLPATFTFVGGLHPGQPGQLAISWRGKEATELTIWVDFNGDDHWTDDEIIAKNRRIEPGIEVVGFEVPPDPRFKIGFDQRLKIVENKLESLVPNTLKPWVTAVASASVDCNWSSGYATADFSGTVNASTVFDDGIHGPRLYVGGSFVTAGNQRIRYLAVWDGTAWSAVSTGLFGYVYALTVYDDGSGAALYAGGTLFLAGGTPVNRIARWDGTVWSALGTGLNGPVYSLAVYDDGSGPVLVAAGSFSTAGGAPAQNIATWDGAAWSNLGTGVNGTAYSLCALTDIGGNSTLYVGGSFSSAGTASVANIASWDGVTWHSPGSGLDGTVQVLASYDDGSGTKVYAGGNFTKIIGGFPGRHLVRWDGTAWQEVGNGTNGIVYSLAAHSDGLYVGGAFTSVGTFSASHIARWSQSGWSALAGGLDGYPYTLTFFDHDGGGPSLFAAGHFTAAGGLPAGCIARWRNNSWATQLSGIVGSGANSNIFDMAVFNDGSGPVLCVGGYFTSIGGIPASFIAKWDGHSWSAIADGPNGGVRALEVFDSGSGPRLFVAGVFSAVGGVAASHIAQWDGHSWTPIGAGTNGNIRELLAANVASSPKLYVGGEFTTAGGMAANHIAAWNGSSWELLATGVNGPVSALTRHDDGNGPVLYVGGDFTSAGGMAAAHIAKWDGTSWSTLGSGSNSGVSALTFFDAGDGVALFAGGSFTTMGGASCNRIARWDGTTWSPVGGGMNNNVTALTAFDDGTGSQLYASGSFTSAGGVYAKGIARWDGVQWSRMQQGFVDSIYGAYTLMAFPQSTPGRLYAGGGMRNAGYYVSSNLASWSCTCSANTALTAGEWQMIGLPCSPTGATVGDIFGDDLPPADYDLRWVVYEWDRVAEQYTKLSLGSALDQGTGYWIRTLDTGQSISVDGRPTVTSCSASPSFSAVGCFAEPLTGSAAGRWNMIGHPMAYTVNWADVRFVDDSGNEWTPSQAEAHGVASKNLYTWNGSAYQTWDDVTPGMLGTLGVFEGQWVKAYSTATALRIPAMPASGSVPTPAQPSEEGEWLIRLTATSGKLADPGNVLGRLSDSREGLDAHDLPEMAPFNGDYLTIVFPHPQWRTTAWAYTTDFRALEKTGTSDTGARGGPALPQPMGEVWHFEVRSGTARRKVVLHWQGPANILRRSLLVDLASGREIHPRPGSSYAVEMTKTTHSFNWIVMPPNDDGRRR